MSAGISITGTKGVINTLEGKSLKGSKTATLIVGFSAPYAAYAHENLTMKHRVGQAKFLEEASRVHREEVNALIVKNLKNKESLKLSLERAGKFLLIEAQKLTPVLTGRLRDSGFVNVT